MMPRKKKPRPTFEVALLGDAAPEQLPLRVVSDALAAVQDLASGRDPYELQAVPDELAIGLLDVRRGSAVFQCVARDPQLALSNLTLAGQLLAAPVYDDNKSDRLAAMLHPLAELSRIAKSLACTVVVRVSKHETSLLSVLEDTYSRVSGSILVRGETTIIGQVERAGGATEMRCLLRVPNRRKLLYCDVKDKQLVRRLGQHLYESIAATGVATWINRSWRVQSFEIHDFTQPRLGPVDEMIKTLRAAGLDSWDAIPDPKRYLERCGT